MGGGGVDPPFDLVNRHLQAEQKVELPHNHDLGSRPCVGVNSSESNIDVSLDLGSHLFAKTKSHLGSILISDTSGFIVLKTKIGTAMRTKVRYAQRGGLQKATGADQLEGFYDVLGENMRRRGSPMYGRPFMQRLLEALGPNATVLTLSHEGQVVSGTFLAWFNGVLYMPFASSRPSVFKLRANYLLYWEVICLGIEKRLRALDFGTSPKSSPGLEFKGAWRPVFQPVTSALYARDGKVPAIEVADSPFAQTAIKLWSKLPRSFVEAIGPSICKWVA